MNTRTLPARIGVLLLVMAVAVAAGAAFTPTSNNPVTFATTHPLSLDLVADRQIITDVVAQVAYHADAGDWDALRALYADQVRLDYTSLNGGEPATMRADDLIGAWRGLLPGFDLTQHLLGPVVVELDGDHATARAHVRALHRIDGAEHGEDWVVGGHYTYRLARQEGRWRITDHTLGSAYQEGNRGLPATAQQRAASSATAQRPR